MPDDIREQERRLCEQKCLRCQEEYQKNNRYDESMTFLLNRCTTCPNGLKLKQLDPPQNRGKVGNWQPW